ncbi:MAG: NAD(P)-binding domain-containing protein, partial [Bdellovibrionota bacterium]
MKIAILGTGMVGEALATKLAQLGHEVMMGSRTANNEAATAWAKN